MYYEHPINGLKPCPILSDEEIAAYDAPFPDQQYKAGVRRFPAMVPDHPEAQGAELSRRAGEWLKTEWAGQSFMAIGMQDPVLGPPVMMGLRKFIIGSQTAEILIFCATKNYVKQKTIGEELGENRLRRFR
jgi:hypothetical protein